MTKKRVLTAAERQHLLDVNFEVEQQRYPDHEITVKVAAETGDDGEPVITIVKSLLIQ